MTFSWHESAGKALGPQHVYVKENYQDSLNFGSILAGHFTVPPERLPGVFPSPSEEGSSEAAGYVCQAQAKQVGANLLY